jgi:hypothetical protein
MHRPSWIFDYWIVFVRLFRGIAVIDETLDIPLRDAKVRCILAVVWTMLCWYVAVLLQQRLTEARWLLLAPGLRTEILIILCVFGIAAAYGLLRLFTLVSHTVTIHLLRARGQRLRLLNAETTILSLSPLAATSWWLAARHGWPGWVLLGLTLTWAAILFTRAYNRIFHRRGLQGLVLWIGSTLLTVIVLTICLVSVLAAGGVLVVLLIAVLRTVHTASSYHTTDPGSANRLQAEVSVQDFDGLSGHPHVPVTHLDVQIPAQQVHGDTAV